MKLKELQQNWDKFGETDAMWSILTVEGKENNQWDEERFFNTGLRFMRRQLEYFDEKEIALNRGNALDFGCGIGRLTQGMAHFFESVSGVDIAPSMIDIANEKNKFPGSCTYFLNEKADLSLFGNASFDFVMTIIVLQHMQPQYAKAYIKEFQRILKPGGLMLFQVPSEPPSEHRIVYEKKKRWYRRLLTRVTRKPEGPVMEMYWIPRHEVVSLADSLGLVTEYINEDNKAGSDWGSYSYCFRKP